MKLHIEIKEAHTVITDSNNEVAFAYSVKDVDVEIDLLVLIKTVKGLMTAVDAPEEAATAVMRGFTTAMTGMSKKAPAFDDSYKEVV